MAALLQTLLERSPKDSNSLGSLLDELLPVASLLEASNEESIRSAFDRGLRLFIASQPGESDNLSLGDELTDTSVIASLPVDMHGVALRLIALPAAAVEAHGGRYLERGGVHKTT